MADKELATITDSAELAAANSFLILQGANSREATVELVARFMRGSQVNDQTGTTYTTVLNDAGKIVRMSNASANTITIPPNSSVAYAIGTRIYIAQIAAGTTTVAQGAGVTINTADDLILGTQWQMVSAVKVATDTWDLSKGGGSSDLDGLSDVDLTTTAPRDNDRLVYNGTDWVPIGSSICILAGKSESFTQGANKVVVWTEVEDLDGYFGGGTVADEQWVFPFTGRYRVEIKVTLTAAAHTDFFIQAVARKDRGATTTFDNDYPELRVDERYTLSNTNIRRHIYASGIIDATANDEMDYLINHQPVNRSIDTTSYVYIEYIGPTP